MLHVADRDHKTPMESNCSSLLLSLWRPAPCVRPRQYSVPHCDLASGELLSLRTSLRLIGHWRLVPTPASLVCPVLVSSTWVSEQLWNIFFLFFLTLGTCHNDETWTKRISKIWAVNCSVLYVFSRQVQLSYLTHEFLGSSTLCVCISQTLRAVECAIPWNEHVPENERTIRRTNHLVSQSFEASCLSWWEHFVCLVMTC